ncbi:MAG: hypothetical protein R3F17_11120 [Planctomycetota bacterium]
MDLTGDPTPQDNNSFAMMEVDLADDGSNNPVDTADEALEEFLPPAQPRAPRGHLHAPGQPARCGRTTVC